jgi:hypothetical protein
MDTISKVKAITKFGEKNPDLKSVKVKEGKTKIKVKFGKKDEDSRKIKGHIYA